MLFNKNSPFVIFFFKSLLYFLFEKEKIRLVESLSLVLCQDEGPAEKPGLLGREGNMYLYWDSRGVQAEGAQAWVGVLAWHQEGPCRAGGWMLVLDVPR